MVAKWGIELLKPCFRKISKTINSGNFKVNKI